jgi:deoxyribonuclease-4
LTPKQSAGKAGGFAAGRPAGSARIGLPGGRRAGVHLPMGLGLVRAVERADAIGASALQIFSDNPTAWRRRAEVPPEAETFRRRLVELDVGPVAIHAAYLINLAGPDDELFGKSVDLLHHELEHAGEFGARFVNVHVGSHRGAGLDAGMRRLIDGLERAVDGLPDGGPGLAADGAARGAADGGTDGPASGAADGGTDGAAPLIVLENSSGGGYAIGVTIEELAMILDAATDRGLGDRIGFCLDVAHLWGAGYDVSSPAAIDDVLATFDRSIGLDRLAMVHLNDSTSGMGSRADRHAHLGEGQIGREGLAHFLCHPALDHVAFYLETPGMEDGYDAVNVARLGDLATGRPLTSGLEPDPADGAMKATE